MTKATRTTRVATTPLNEARLATQRALAPRETAPPTAFESEIPRELNNLSNANRNLSDALSELYDRLAPVLLPIDPDGDGSAREGCETHIGHRLREEETAVNISTARVRALINRLGI